MSENQFKLTIGIPTYNSIQTLIDTLSSLQYQITDNLIHEVEILLSDNGSNYDLEKELLGFFSRDFFNKLTINKNPSNIGFDGNLITLVNLAQGRYIKFLADDDTIDSSYILELLNLIELNEFDVLIDNFRFLTKDLKKIIQERWFDLTNELEINSKYFAVKSTNTAYGQVSSLTFRREILLDLDLPARKNNHIHVYWLLSLYDKAKIIIRNQVSLNVRQGSPNFSGNNVINILTPLGGLRAIIDSKLSDKELRQELINSQSKYCLSQLHSIDSHSFTLRKKIFLEFYSYFKHSVIFWALWAPYIFIPQKIRKVLKFARKCVILMAKSSKRV